MRWTQGICRKRALVLCLASYGLSATSMACAQTSSPIFMDMPGVVIVWAADAPGDAGNAPVISDIIFDTGTGSTGATSGDIDIIGTDVFTVVSGSLTPVASDFSDNNGAPFRIQRVPGGAFTTDFQPDGVTDASDTFDAFGLRGNSDINTRRAEVTSSFFVASNTAFSIDATAQPVGTTSPDAFNRIRLQLTVTVSGDDGIPFGSAAQLPNSNGPGAGAVNARRLSVLATNPNVFNGNQATARVPGNLAAQSVRFDARYRYNSGNYDLSDGVIDAAAEVVYTVYVP